MPQIINLKNSNEFEDLNYNHIITMNIAIILAGGKSVRMEKNKNKAFLLLNKKEIIYYSLKTFQQHSKIDKIIIVIAKKDIKKMQNFLNKNKFSKVVAIVEGGKERQDSGYNGLKFIKEYKNNAKQDIILFHNAANPFVSTKEISQLITATKKYSAAVAGTAVKDTIKEVDKNKIVKRTLRRQNLWAVQTPQAIKFPLAWKGFSKAKQDKFLGTDDVSLVERLGKKVKIVPCSEQNFKITTPADLEKARMIVNNRY